MTFKRNNHTIQLKSHYNIYIMIPQVCTFSSQICRIAYELRNAEGPKDYSQAYRSLDDIWYFAGGSSHVQVR